MHQSCHRDGGDYNELKKENKKQSKRIEPGSNLVVNVFIGSGGGGDYKKLKKENRKQSKEQKDSAWKQSGSDECRVLSN